MPSNINQDTLPYYWCSANDNVVYTFKFNQYNISGASASGGFIEITTSTALDVSPQVGDKMFINNTLQATCTVLSVTSSTIFIVNIPDSSIAAFIGFFKIYHIRVPVFSIYKGFKSGETYEVNLPYTKVVDIKPSIQYNGTPDPFQDLFPTNQLPRIEINIKGITKYLFTIVPNTVANSIDFSMFNAVRLSWDGLQTINNVAFAYTLVLNSAITNAELQYKYIGEGIQLLPIDKVIIPTSGAGFVSVINGLINSGFPTIIKFIDGNQV
jgi:hypothetical protein